MMKMDGAAEILKIVQKLISCEGNNKLNDSRYGTPELFKINFIRVNKKNEILQIKIFTQ